MLTIIHGDDTASSRKYFSDQKNSHSEVIALDGEKVTLTDLKQVFEGGGLFSVTKNVFIEHLFGKKKKSSDYAVITTYLQTNASSHNIFLWEGKEIDRSTLSPFKSASVKVFKLPQTLFLFLDSVKPGSSKTLISLFHKTLETSEMEMVFFMLVRQIRILLAMVEKSTEEIDEVKRLAPWQKSKLQKQTASFEKSQLREIYKKLFRIEIGLKTGTLPNPLISSIDFLLLEI